MSWNLQFTRCRVAVSNKVALMYSSLFCLRTFGALGVVDASVIVDASSENQEVGRTQTMTLMTIASYVPI
jgi:hypothetical protein